ncbi:MAG: PAS domain-containing protein [Chloroflexi bacterium]|nr:PAS domain-containing protein [Chloroflexota bacterium]
MTGILNIALWRMAAFAVLIPIAMVAVFLIWQDYEARRSATITHLGLKSAQINAQLEDFVNTADAATGALATLVANVNPGLVHGASLTPGVVAPADQLLLGFLSRSTQFSEAAIVDVSGKVLAASHPFVTGTRDDYREFLGIASDAGGFAVSDVFVPGGEDEPYVLFSYPMPAGSGPAAYVVTRSTLGTVSGALDMSIGFPSSAKSGIFDSSGKVLAGTGYEPPHPGGAIGRDVSGSAVWAQVEARAESRETGAWFGPGLDNVDRIIFYEFPEKTPWVTTVAFAQAELFGPLWQRVWIVSGALLATMAGTVLVVEIARRRERAAWSQVTRERQTLHSVLDGARDGIVVLDSSGAAAYANRRLGDLFGVAAERLIGEPAARLASTLARGAGLGKRDADGMYRMMAGSGVAAEPLHVGGPDERAIQVIAYPVRQSDGEIVGRTLVAHDVTEESRVQRMKSDFVGHASHQLRTPLASILTSSELLLNGPSDPASRERKIRLVYDEALRMRQTINSLLNLSQIESGRITLETRSVGLRKLFAEAVATASARTDRHSFSVEISDEAERVWADRSKLSEVLSSLIDNAVKYSPDGGRVQLIASLTGEKEVTVRVRDQGVGIDRADQASLFSPYQRASARSRGLAGGTGLGLHMAHSLVELMGGKISVESSLGVGSTFSFTLPGAPLHLEETPVKTFNEPATDLIDPHLVAATN